MKEKREKKFLRERKITESDRLEFHWSLLF